MANCHPSPSTCQFAQSTHRLRNPTGLTQQYRRFLETRWVTDIVRVPGGRSIICPLRAYLKKIGKSKKKKLIEDPYSE